MSTPQNQSRQIAVLESPGALTRFLEQAKPALQMALPDHLKAERMIRLAVTAWSTTPAIRKCTGQSILGSLIMAAQMGLEPGVRGQAYLIPYGDNCTLVPGWQGLVQLLNNSGRATAWSGAVFEGDEWDFQLGSEPKCFHRPGANHGDPDKIIAFYACGKVNGSEQPVIEAWTADRVWKHRDRFNKVGKRHYSYAHPEMYGRKVVLLQVLKYMPASVQLANAVAAANAADAGNPVRMEDGVVIEMQPEVGIASGTVGKTAIEETATQDEKPATATETKTEPKGVPTVDDLRATLKSRLGKVNASTKDLVSVLMRMQLIKDAVVFNDLPFDVLLAAEERWEEISASLAPK